MKNKFYIDMHTTPASVFKVIFGDSYTKKCKKYKGNSKWINADILELERLVQIGSAREVEENVAREFELEFDKNLI